jgi:hypothetical protein
MVRIPAGQDLDLRREVHTGYGAHSTPLHSQKKMYVGRQLTSSFHAVTV